MSNSKGKFSFSTVQKFDNHINNQIPGFDILNDIILSVAIRYIEHNTNIYDLGSSTGRLIEDLYAKYKDIYRGTKYYGIETNQNFLKDKRFSEDINYLNLDIASMTDFNNSSLIISLFTIQFLPNAEKQKVMQKIYNSLNYKGAFIWAEKTHLNDSILNYEISMDHFTKKLERGYNHEEVLNDEISLRNQMKLNTENQNIELLKQAGFTKFDIIWKVRNFECLIATK